MLPYAAAPVLSEKLKSSTWLGIRLFTKASIPAVDAFVDADAAVTASSAQTMEVMKRIFTEIPLTIKEALHGRVVRSISHHLGRPMTQIACLSTDAVDSVATWEEA